MTNTATILNINSFRAFYKSLVGIIIFAKKKNEINTVTPPFSERLILHKVIENRFPKNLWDIPFTNHFARKKHIFSSFLGYSKQKITLFLHKQNKESAHWRAFLVAITSKFSGSPPDKNETNTSANFSGFCSD